MKGALLGITLMVPHTKWSSSNYGPWQEESEWLVDMADATSKFSLTFANGRVTGPFYFPTFSPYD